MKTFFLESELTASDTHDHEQKLVQLHAQLSAAMMERGLNQARSDDPHLYSQARLWLTKPGSHFELRVIAGKDNVVTRGLICDDGGDPLVEVFTITGHTGQAQ
ncbi:MAG: hypothetical protein ABIR54_07115 [Burkholderiaceae bacterium]